MSQIHNMVPVAGFDFDEISLADGFFYTLYTLSPHLGVCDTARSNVDVRNTTVWGTRTLSPRLCSFGNLDRFRDAV